VAGAKKNVGRDKEKPKSLQSAGISATLGRTLDLKVTSWGCGKRSQLMETPHFSFLPSLAASCVGLFIFFKFSKLENLAIKLVEIGSEKHKFLNLFL
jgi:hypothetical protein